MLGSILQLIGRPRRTRVGRGGRAGSRFVDGLEEAGSVSKASLISQACSRSPAITATAPPRRPDALQAAMHGSAGEPCITAPSVRSQIGSMTGAPSDPPPPLVASVIKTARRPAVP